MFLWYFGKEKKKEREGGRKGKKWLLSTCVLRTCLRLNWTKFGTNFFDRDSKTANIDPIKRSIVITLMQIYNEKEQVGQKEIQNIQFKEKKKARKHVTGLPWKKEKLRRGLIYNGIKGKVPKTRSNTAQLPNWKGLRESLLLERNNKQKLLQMWFNEARLHPKLVAKLISVVHTVLALESWK